jgi:hypothetical protein
LTTLFTKLQDGSGDFLSVMESICGKRLFVNGNPDLLENYSSTMPDSSLWAIPMSLPCFISEGKVYMNSGCASVPDMNSGKPNLRFVEVTETDKVDLTTRKLLITRLEM